MQYFRQKAPTIRKPQRFLWRYSFAVAVSALAGVVQIYLSRAFTTPLTPFLAAFAAVICSAGWAGFGPGLLSTFIATGWCGLSLYIEHRHSLAGQGMREVIFFAEGLLLSMGSARLHRALGDAARSQDWHRKLVDTASEGIWVVNDQGTITYANPRIAEIVGTQMGDLTGAAMDDYFLPDDRSVEQVRFRNRRVGMKEQFDRRLLRRDGSEAWVLTCSNAFVDAQTGRLNVLSMMTDITERKRAEQALRRSEERFRSLFENVLEGVYQSTPEGRILAANPMLLRMLGLSDEAELNDVNIARDLYVDSGVRRDLLEKLEHDGSFQSVEYQLRRTDDQIITVQENARVVRDEEGRVIYYEGTLTDITERARIERQLRQAQSVDALGRLAGSIANDFSNVLTVLSGYAHLVLDDLPASHPARNHAAQMVVAAESAAGLTRQLLSFGHRESGIATVTDLNSIVRDAEEPIRTFLREQHAGTGADVIVSLDSRPLPVCADPGHIRQILLSLTANVRDSAREGDALRLATALSRGAYQTPQEMMAAPAGSWAVITVQSSEALFSGADQKVAEPADGFGVSTTQAILSQYGGILSMERLSTGTIGFAVYLPVMAEAAPDPIGLLPEIPDQSQPGNDISSRPRKN